MRNILKKISLALVILIAVLIIVFLFRSNEDAGRYEYWGSDKILDTKTGKIYLFRDSQTIVVIDVVKEAKSLENK